MMSLRLTREEKENLVVELFRQGMTHALVLNPTILYLGLHFGWWKLSELTSIILAVLVGGIPTAIIFLFKDSNRSARSKVVSSNTSPKSAF